MGTFFKIIGILIAIAAATVLSSLAAAAGVGMVNSHGCDPMGLAVLVPLCYGLFWGFPVSVITAIAVCTMTPKYSHRFAAMLFVPPLIIFVGFAVIFGIDDRGRRQQETACQKIISTCEKDPAALHALIAKAQTTRLSGPENQAFKSIVESQAPIPAEDIPVLILGFKKNGLYIGYVLRRITTEEQLRAIYESHKNPPQYEILSSLINHRHMPPDILQEMVRLPEPRLVTEARRRIAKNEEEAQLQNLLDRCKTDPKILHEMVIQIHVRHLSNQEIETLCLIVRSPKTIIMDEDIPVLLAYFGGFDTTAFRSILPKITKPERLRDLYAHASRKNPPDYEMFYELAMHPLTPPDILQAMSQDPKFYFAKRLSERIAQDKNKAASTKE